MMTARIVVLTIALSAGGVAAYLVSNTNKQQPTPAAPVVRLPTTEELVAKADIGLSQTIKPGALLWQCWPDAASNNNNQHNKQPKTTNQQNNTNTQTPIITGE